MHAATISRDSFLLLDGGLATELENRGMDLNHRLWSAKILLQQPEIIRAAHLAYLEAGAQCIVTASYQASERGFTDAGYSSAQAEHAVKLSVDLAIEAIEQFTEQHPQKNRPLVAASIGPYGAYLADGSEYRGDYRINEQELVEFHRPGIDWLSQSAADILACETIPSLPEARALNTLLGRQPKPAWISFSCRDGGHLHDGTPLGQLPEVFAQNPNIVALGVNCTAPQYVGEIIDTLRPLTDKALVVYPNSGEQFNSESKTWEGTSSPLEVAAAAVQWRKQGANLIGGCCRMGPEHIRSMAAALG